MNLRPTDDHVVIRPCSPETKSPGGIVLPENAQRRSQRGTVLGVGPGRALESGGRVPAGFAEGAEVLYAQYAGHEIEFEGETLTVLRVADVLAVVAG